MSSASAAERSACAETASATAVEPSGRRAAEVPQHGSAFARAAHLGSPPPTPPTMADILFYVGKLLASTKTAGQSKTILHYMSRQKHA